MKGPFLESNPIMTVHRLVSALPVLPTVLDALTSIEAEVRLRFLLDDHHPMPSGGVFVLQAAGGQHVIEIIEPLAAGPEHRLALEACSATLTLTLDAAETRLLQLELALDDCGLLHERIDVEVSSRGIAPEDASFLPNAPESYTWRLSGQAVLEDGGRRLRLAFELVQEAEPTDHFDAQASTRLAFVDDGGGEQRATIKIKRSGVGPIATP